MRKRRSIPDKHSVGRSTLVPYNPSEEASERHRRRLETNMRRRAEVEDWCRRHGVTLSVKNNNHHWMFQHQNQLIEWWPSSAKMVHNKRWHRGIHVHDYRQALQQISRIFNLTEVVLELHLDFQI